MSERAIEFVETWVSQQIEKLGDPPQDIDALAKQWASQCLEVANQEGIQWSEINDVFDDLPAFIAGEIEEAEDRDEDESEEDLEGDDYEDDEDENEDDENKDDH